MTVGGKYFYLIGSFLLVSVAGRAPLPLRSSLPENQFYALADFPLVRKIDAHVHIRTADTAMAHQAGADNFRLLTIVVDEPPGISLQQEYAIRQKNEFPDRVAFATTFSVGDWNSEHWAEEAIAGLKRSFQQGAIAVKVYKNIGMVLRDRSGRFVMVDDRRLAPVFQYLVVHHVPVIGHLGEPRNCWLPMKEMTMASDKRYYTRHPEFYMFLHPEYPSYADQIRARDHMLARYPGLRFVGAHLGSLEWSTDELAKRLDRFPDMAVDMAARVANLQYQTRKDRQKVRDFCIRYQDRLIYGTDRIDDGSRPAAEMEHFVHEAWLKDWRFFCTDDTLRSSSFDGAFRGLELPREVIDKIYFKNAEKWFPPMKDMK